MLTNRRFLVPSVISTSITTLLRELESCLEPHLLAMSRTAWNNADSIVSSQSTYMTDLVLAAQVVVDAVRELVEKKKYLRNFYDKAAGYESMTTRLYLC